MKLTVCRVLTLACLVVLLILLFASNSTNGEEHHGKKLSPEEELMEYDIRKQNKFREKFCRNQDRTNKNLKYKRLCTKFNRNYLKFYLALFVIISVGALIRTFLRVFEINLPYTVILIIFGLLVGLGARSPKMCVEWSMFTWIARMPPKIILNVFLPILVYESAFSMKAHVFMRSSVSILILALPGMLITTFITAGVCMQFFMDYHWSFEISALYGSIISATDPVAVVAILKEIGTSEMLTVMIEGESLLNDGVAILLYEIFLEVVKSSEEGNLGLKIFWMFCRITIGGPMFGWLMAKLSILFLSRIFNDAAVEVSITLVAAYLTYFIGEAFLGVSGVMAVVALGIVMSMERTCISPEVQGLLLHFWEMVGYLGNTVLFVMVGIVISETAINSVTFKDVYYLIFLYFALNISRFLMIVVLSPFLSHVGYGLSWQNMLVMTWGGLRGAVGICLALEVFKDRDLCDQITVGPKFLLQTAGIVILTLLINGTTTKGLLSMLKLTQLSIGKIQDMGNAVKQIQSAQQRTLAILKHNRFLADSNWDIVAENTNFENPYAKSKIQAMPMKVTPEVEAAASLMVQVREDDHHVVCPSCEEDVEVEPTADEYRELTEESRLRLLKAMKVSCWRQFDQGVITEVAVQVLVEFIETCEDKPFQMLHADELKKYWTVRGCLAWLRDKLLPYTLGAVVGDEEYSQPKHCWRVCFFKVATNEWFDGFIHTVILLNMIPVMWEVVYICQDKQFTYAEIIGFLITNGVFTLIYLSELGFKIIGLGLGVYCSSKWNILDFAVLTVTLTELIISLVFYNSAHDVGEYQDHYTDTDFLKFLRFIRLLRIARVFRLFKPLVPPIMRFLNSRINVFLFLGYDIGKGLATAIEDVGKFLPQMIENSRVYAKFRTALEEQRLHLILEMGLLQKDHPGIAIAVKTRHASRGVLNQMRESLAELKEDGLVDDKEFELLLKELEEKMKRLWDSPPYMSPPRPEMLLANLQWVSGDTELLTYLLKQATLLHFAVGDIIYNTGDPPNGVFVIVSGVVKITYEPSYDRLKARDERGIIPNIEVYSEYTFEDSMSDYYTSGGVLGEMGVVTGDTRAGSVTCETGVVVYHLNQTIMSEAIAAFDDKYDSLESRIWRSVGMRIAAVVLPTQPAFQSWTMDKLKTHLELSAVPIGKQYLNMTIPEFITETVVIYGQVVNAQNEEEIFTAPAIIPHSVTKIKSIVPKPPKDTVPVVNVTPRLLVIANEEMEHEHEETNEHESSEAAESHSTASIHKCVLARTKRNYIVEDEVIKMRRQSGTQELGVRAKKSYVSQQSSATEYSESVTVPAPPAGTQSSTRPRPSGSPPNNDDKNK